MKDSARGRVASIAWLTGLMVVVVGGVLASRALASDPPPPDDLAQTSYLITTDGWTTFAITLAIAGPICILLAFVLPLAVLIRHLRAQAALTVASALLIGATTVWLRAGSTRSWVRFGPPQEQYWRGGVPLVAGLTAGTLWLTTGLVSTGRRMRRTAPPSGLDLATQVQGAGGQRDRSI